jgi:3-oxoacyl-[acyl-carrier protein] reductase
MADTRMPLGIDGDAALVTASSSGLGKASARALAAAGADVVINGRDENRLAAAAADLASEPGSVVAHAGDLTDPDVPGALVDRTVEEFGGLDHLVTNSGGPPTKPFVETTDEEWDDAHDLLVMSVVRTIRAAVEHLRASESGTVVAITSRAVEEPIERFVLSNAVRSGVVGLEKTLSRELAPDVRVNTVLPGTHETERIRDVVEAGVERGDYDSYEAGVAEFSADLPLERLGDPRELGDTVAFLSSERASFINGVALPVDGGENRSSL